jgi:hypothetical protein
MSTGLTVAPRPWSGRTTAVARRLASVRTPLLAFAASRLLVGLAGASGVFGLTLHDPVAAARARALGPVGNLLAASVDRFDAGYYLDIARHGFGNPAAGRVAFFPLYPLLIRLTTPLTGSAVIAGALISAAAFLVALVLVQRVTALELGPRAAETTVWLLALAPLSFFFTAIYTESLLLALELGAVLAARSGRWRLACGLGALATLTRPVGIAMAVLLAGLRLGQSPSARRSLSWVLALPAVLIAYLIGLAVDGRGLLAPFAAQAHWHRMTVGPLVAIAAAAWAAGRGVVQIFGGTPIYDPQVGGVFSGPAEAIILFAVLAGVLALLHRGRRRLPWPYPAFTAAVLLITLSSPAAGQPLWSQDRFALVLFPIWMIAGDGLARRPRLRVLVLGCGAALLVFYTAQFASWSFVA